MTPLPQPDATSTHLNENCFCVPLDETGLRGFASRELPELDESTRAQFIAAVARHPVFISSLAAQRVHQAVGALHRLFRLHGYQQKVLKRSPAIAARDPVSPGLLYSFDFHLSSDPHAWPQLIEVNSNAGGMMLALLAARYQQSATQSECAVEAFDTDDLTNQLVDMFLAEWRHTSGARQPNGIAIVDDTPHAEFLYPEMLLYRNLLRSRGIRAQVVDAGALQWDGTRLHARHNSNETFDLVYNRSTDFYLDDPRHAALRTAYEAGVPVTPHPRGHALYANKENLVLMHDRHALARWGLAHDDIDVLARTVPETRIVRGSDAALLWRDRKRLFFKPAAAYGSRGAYRGDKITRRTFERIVEGDDRYVAQAYAPPGTRALPRGSSPDRLKMDLRCFTYGGTALALTARLYHGQTTNLRTPQGGFAAVYTADAPSDVATQPAIRTARLSGC